MEPHERLRSLRESLKKDGKPLNQQYFADIMGIQRAAYTLIEQGHRKLDTRYIEKLSKALGVSPAIFFMDAALTPRGEEPFIITAYRGATPEQQEIVKETLGITLADLQGTAPDQDKSLNTALTLFRKLSKDNRATILSLMEKLQE